MGDTRPRRGPGRRLVPLVSSAIATILVPFRAGGKRRLALAPGHLRDTLARAMLGDVVAACSAVAETFVVTSDDAAELVADELGAKPLHDSGGGQGRAVAAALRRAAAGRTLVVNADLPCATPRDLRVLLSAMPSRGLALVEARDGTTNALALADAALFAPLYGNASASRFRAHAAALGAEAAVVDLPNLADDVDTLEDLERIEPRAGARTRAVLHDVRVGAAS